MANEDLPIKTVPSQIKLWKVTPYKDSKIYIRQFGKSLFEYLVLWKDNIYSDNIIITPEEGKKKLTNAQEHTAFAWIFAAATTTVDTLRGDKVDESKLARAEGVLEVVAQLDKPKN